jgi:hypothetical protein
MALQRLVKKDEGSPMLKALSDQDLKDLGLEQSHLGEILPHRFDPFPQRGGLEGRTDGKRMAQSSSDFAVACISVSSSQSELSSEVCFEREAKMSSDVCSGRWK